MQASVPFGQGRTVSLSGLFLIFCFSLIAISAFGQNLDWSSYIQHASTTTDPNDRIAAFDVVEDVQGNVIVCGGHRGTHDFDPGPGETIVVSGNKGNVINIYDIFVAKYDPTGALMWVIPAGDNSDDNHANSVETDSQGNVFVTGKFTGTVDFDPGPGTYDLTATSGDGDLFLVKYDPNGIIQWGFVIQGTTNFRQSGFDIDINETANRLVIGARLDDPIDVDPLDPGNTVSFNTGGEDAAILMYDLDGNYIYAINFNDPSGGGWVAVEVDDNGNVFSFLSVGASADMDPGPAGVGVLGPASALTKYDPMGNYLWHKQFNGGWTMTGSLELDPCDNIVIAGSFSGSASNTYDFEPGNPAASWTGDGSSHAAFVAKFTNDGNFTWLNVGDNAGSGSTRVGSVGVNGYYNGGMALDKDGDIYLTGSTDAALSFGGMAVGGSGNRGYVVKLDKTGASEWAGNVAPTSWGLTWLMNVAVGEDYDVNIFGKSSNETTAPFGGAGSGITAQNAYTYHITQTIVPPNPQIGLTQASQCTSDTVDFTILNEIPDSVFWNFGDPGSGASNLATGISTQHVYSSQGTFPVQAIAYFGCIPDTLDTIVTVNFTIITLDLGPDTTICQGDVITLDATVGTNASYLWSDNSTNPTLDVSTTGTVWVEVDTAGCVQHDTIQVTVMLPPDGGPDSTEFVCLTTQDSLDLSNYITPSTLTGIWSEQSVTPTGTFNPQTGWLTNDGIIDGVYNFLYVIPGIGTCPGDSAMVTLNLTQAPNAGADSLVFMCGVNGTLVDVSQYGNGDAGGIWSEVTVPVSGQFDGTTNQLDVSGLDGSYEFQYMVNGIDACVGTNDSALVQIDIEFQQSAGADSSIQLCNSDPDFDLSALLNGNTEVGDWWDVTNNWQSITPVFSTSGTPGIYDFAMVVGNNCKDTALFTIQLGLDGNAGLDGATTFCVDGGEEDLVTFLGGTPDANGTWIPGLNSGTGMFNPSTDNAGSYLYIASGDAFCAADTARLDVSIIDLSALDIDAVPSFCGNDTLTQLSATMNGGVWSGPGITPTGLFDPVAAGTGSHEITYVLDSAGCSNTVNVAVFVNELPEVNVPDSLAVCADELLTLSADVSFADSAFWSNGDQGITLMTTPTYLDINSVVSYVVSAVNNCGTIHDTIGLIVQDCELYIHVPNAFTPDGDEFNQTFLPYLEGIDQTDYELIIFNRWGEAIFVSRDLQFGWDGTYNGAPVEIGTYTWKIRYKNPRIDERQEVHGHVSVLR